MDYRIFPPEELIDVTVNLPLSKSVVNRQLVMAALAEKEVNLPDSLPEDIIAMRRGLKPLGDVVNVGAAGTAMRFLVAYYAAKPGVRILIEGSERMSQRPIAPLVDTLRLMGANIEYVEKEGFPPLRIVGTELKGGSLEIDSNVSSQFITALLIISPYLKEGLNLQMGGEPVSVSYIDMTLKLMRKYGISAFREGNTVTVHPGRYVMENIELELDWTSASYWAEIVALMSAFVRLPGLSFDSVQGDTAVVELFKPLGVNVQLSADEDISESVNEIEMVADCEVYSRYNRDLSNNPDLAQTLAVTCCLLGIPFRITGVSTLRVKETDRLQALKDELIKFGCIIETYNNDTIEWDGRRYPILEEPKIDTYKDHRMALAFAPAALYIPGIVIKDVEVVSKSYPTFWEDLELCGFTLEEVG